MSSEKANRTRSDEDLPEQDWLVSPAEAWKVLQGSNLGKAFHQDGAKVEKALLLVVVK